MAFKLTGQGASQSLKLSWPAKSSGRRYPSVQRRTL